MWGSGQSLIHVLAASRARGVLLTGPGLRLSGGEARSRRRDAATVGDVSESEPQPAEVERRDPGLSAIIERASAASIQIETRIVGTGTPREREYVMIFMPNGRRLRSVVLFPNDFEDFLGLPFENYVFLGDYQAFVDTSTGEIEAIVTVHGSSRNAPAALLARLPGVEAANDDAADVDPELVEQEDSQGEAPEDGPWRLRLEDGGKRVEISHPSLGATAMDLAYGRRAASVKISGVPSTDHDSALAVLERYGASLLLG